MAWVVLTEFLRLFPPALTSFTMLHHIIYMSQARQPMTQVALAELLQQAQQANEQQHITGVLVYGGDQFMQVMEGEQSVVEALYARIVKDSRHKNPFKLADKAIAERSFSTWLMAFERLTSAQFTQLVGYLAPEQLVHHLPEFGAVDTLLMHKLRELVAPPLAQPPG